MNAILGIHTNVEDENHPGNSHAWITFDKDGQKRDFALYPTNKHVCENGQANGWNNSGTHVREGLDSNLTPTSSLYKELTPEQEAAFFEQIKNHQEYSTRRNNCAHWASKTWEVATGQNLEILHKVDSLNIPSPIGLERSIRENQRQKENVQQAEPTQQKPERNLTWYAAQQKRAELHTKAEPKKQQRAPQQEATAQPEPERQPASEPTRQTKTTSAYAENVMRRYKAMMRKRRENSRDFDYTRDRSNEPDF